MSSSERWIKPAVLSLLSFTFAGLVFRNVFSDNDAVLELAKKKACEGVVLDACIQREVSRGPFGQHVRFTAGKSTKEIECSRAYWLIGEYQCEMSK
ncbi:MAG: hypothetical protein U0165_06355 [Polyangiaceae bacterium]